MFVNYNTVENDKRRNKETENRDKRDWLAYHVWYWPTVRMAQLALAVLIHVTT